MFTTFLIAYRIHSSTTDIIMSSSKKRFNKILEILLQSAFLYTASLAGYIVLSFVHITNPDSLTLYRASFFGGAVLPVTIVRLLYSRPRLSLDINDMEISEYWAYSHGCSNQFFSD